MKPNIDSRALAAKLLDFYSVEKSALSVKRIGEATPAELRHFHALVTLEERIKRELKKGRVVQFPSVRGR